MVYRSQNNHEGMLALQVGWLICSISMLRAVALINVFFFSMLPGHIPV